MDNVLVVGNGAREHAICWKLSQSSQIDKIYCTPGSIAIAEVTNVENVSVDINNHEILCQWIKTNNISLVVVGPENPLVDGIADALQAEGIQCFGPSKSAARIEGGKKFAKEFMVRQGIPTAKYQSFTDPESAKQFIKTAKFDARVVKADGVAAGKGVIVAADKKEACNAVDVMMIEKKFGDAGTTVVIEELLEGEEVSVLAFCDGKTVKTMLPAQDHKRAYNGDRGDNTGGMGAYAPCSLIDATQLQTISESVIQRAVDGLRHENCPFVGVLFAGLMLTENGPQVLEYNCRFGDPETEVILPLLENDLYEIMKACCQGTLHEIDLRWKQNTVSVGVVMASRGYPESSSKGDLIEGLEKVASIPGVMTFHAGTTKKNEKWVTNGGRVLINVCLSNSLVIASSKATTACKMINMEGGHFRTDIGHKGIPRWVLSQGTLSYKASGVDIEAGDSLVSAIIPRVNETRRPGILSGLGGFGAFFDPFKAGYKRPVLVSGTDGVGTKLKVAQAMGKHTTIGQDLVAMCVNDILCHGAEPLFFLDYFACGRLEVGVAQEVIGGIADGCRLAGCSLVGGETAEMPGMYQHGDYDLAGFAVGAVEQGFEMPFKEKIQPGNVVIALPSSGLHSNGFSLARKIVQSQGLSFHDKSPFSDKTIGDELLTPTRIYVQEVLPLIHMGCIRAIAHITGGGLTENIPRVLLDKHKVTLNARKWPIPKIFPWMALVGGISESEMLRTFNCGVGLIMIVPRDSRDSVLGKIKGSVMIGEVQHRNEGEKQVIVENFPEALVPAMSEHIVPLMAFKSSTKRIGILISGTGTNMQAIIEKVQSGDINGEVVTVVSNKAGVEGLTKARNAGVPVKVIPHTDYKSREDFEKEINEHLVNCNVELVVLAGFMRILTGYFVSRWRGKLINLHPALLPSFKGANACQMALDAGVRITGCTVHYVEEEVDTGAIIAQEAVPVETGDTVETLRRRINQSETRVLPKAVQLICANKCSLDLGKGKVKWEGTSH